VQGLLEFAVPHAIPIHQAAVMTIRAIQGAAGGITYALIGPMCQKHTFHVFLTAVVSMTIGFFRLGIATPLLTGGEFCKFGNYSYNFYIVGTFTLVICVLWFIVLWFDTERRRAIDHLIEKDDAPSISFTFSIGKFFNTKIQHNDNYQLVLVPVPVLIPVLALVPVPVPLLVPV
jgi:hypothetical protein